MEIDDRDRLFAPRMRVLDLGAAPGGWSQLAAERVGARARPEPAVDRPARAAAGRVVAVDVLEMAPMPGITVVLGDLYSRAIGEAIEAALEGRPADIVLSDMAPNLTGVKVADQAAASGLWELALDVAGQHLRPDGDFLLKVFEGGEIASFRKMVKARFQRVATRKPAASRAHSSEHYLLARGYRPEPGA